MNKRLSQFCLIFIILSFAYFLLQSPTIIWFNEHMTRDVSRAYEWLELRPSSWWGAEIGFENNKRLPGPFFNLLIAFGILFTGSLGGMIAVKSFLSLACILTFVYVLYRRLGVTPTLIFACFFLTSPLVILVSRNLWNPSFLIPLLCLHYSLMLHPFKGRMYQIAPLLNGIVIFLSVQVHFSSLTILIISTIIFYLYEKRWKAILASLLPVSVLLLIWSQSIAGQGEFLQNTSNQYHLHWDLNFWLTRIKENRYHFFPTHEPIYSHDLFNYLSLVSRYFAGSLIDLIVRFHRVGSYIFWLIYSVAIFYLAGLALRKRFHSLPLLFVMTAVTLIFFVIQTTYAIGHVPYRYGLFLYPLQFLILALAIFHLLEAKSIFAKFSRFLITTFSLIYALTNIVWSYDLDRTMKLSGRSHNGPFETFTVHLKSKLEVLDKSRVLNPHTLDLMDCLHGRLAARMRQDDMTWNHVTRWNSLSRYYPANSPSTESCDQHLFFQDAFGDAQVFKWKPLTLDQFPQDITANYFKEDNFLFKKELRIDAIFPAASIDGHITRVELDFKIKKRKHLYILIDLGKPQHIYHDLQLEIEGQAETLSCTNQYVEFLMSTNCTVNLEKFKQLTLNIKLKFGFNQKPPHQSRLDILTLDHLPKEGY